MISGSERIKKDAPSILAPKIVNLAHIWIPRADADFLQRGIGDGEAIIHGWITFARVCLFEIVFLSDPCLKLMAG